MVGGGGQGARRSISGRRRRTLSVFPIDTQYRNKAGSWFLSADAQREGRFGAANAAAWQSVSLRVCGGILG